MTGTTTTNNNNNNKKFRMAAFDLDGTLLNSNHELSPVTITYLRHLHSKGFIVAIATGRSAACAAHIIEKLDLNSNDDNNNATDGIDDDEVNDGTNNVASSLGFPLVCTNGARGLRIRKSQSDVGVGHTTTNFSSSDSSSRRCTRSNTDPLPLTGHPTNPFLKQTLEISHEIFHNPLSPSLTLKTLALAHSLNCVTNYYHDHHIYAVVRNENQLELTRRYGTLTGSKELYCYLNDLNLNTNNNNGEEKGEKVEEDCDESKSTTTTSMTYYDERNAYGYQKAVELGPPSKLLILCDTSKLDEITSLVRTELNGTNNNTITAENCDAQQQQQKQQQAHVIRGAPPFFVEILHPTVHKGEGLRRLCQSLSVPLEEVIAFGDGDNDLEFLQMAGWGVAMKNGRGVLKEVADEVTEGSNDEDGVVKKLARYEQEGKLHFPKEEK